MAKDNKNILESTTISTRLQILAKDIINRSTKSYRQILERDAYNCLGENFDDFMFVSDEELEEMEEDLSELLNDQKEADAKLAYHKKQVLNAIKSKKRLSKRIDKKQKKINDAKESREYLDKLREEYADQIIYAIDDAVNEVETVLEENARLRKLAPRARITENEIKKICKKYRVSMDEVIAKIDKKNIDCLENYDKYF